MIRVMQYLFVVFTSAFLVISCGGGGGGGGGNPSSIGSEQTGVFIDSNVEGLGFSTPSRTGETNANGEFTYLDGEQVTFSIGGIVLGQVAGARLITPVSLVTGATDETNEVVTNIGQFLQTLDDDGNPDNGILIPDSLVTAAQDDAVDFTSATFDTDVQVLVDELTALTSSGQRNLVSAAAAQSHLKTNLQNQISGNYSGTYSGSYSDSESSGPSSGGWEFVIDDQGNITGQADDGDGGTAPFSGKVNSNGSGATGGSGSGVNFSLSIDSAGNVTGNWSANDPADPSFNASGSLTGSKSQSDNSADGNLIQDGEEANTGEASWPPATVAQILDQHFTNGIAIPFTAPSIDSQGDQDWWSFSGEGDTFFFFVKTGADHQANDLTDMACLVDIFDSSGNQKAYKNPISSPVYQADDGYHKNCEVIFTPPDTGTYYLRVRADDAYAVTTGSYSLYVTKDEHTQFASATNQSKSYSFDVRILNRRFELSRVFTMPDVRAISSFGSITNSSVSNTSSTLDDPLITYYDMDGNYLYFDRSPVGNYTLKFTASPMFLSFSATEGYLWHLYDWSMIPTVTVTITNPNPLPNYDPRYPYCAENTSRLTCESAGSSGKPYVFHAYSSGYTYPNVPLNQTCADYGYSSPSSIFQGSGSTASSPEVGTCLYQPYWFTY